MESSTSGTRCRSNLGRTKWTDINVFFILLIYVMFIVCVCLITLVLVTANFSPHIKVLVWVLTRIHNILRSYTSNMVSEEIPMNSSISIPYPLHNTATMAETTIPPPLVASALHHHNNFSAIYDNLDSHNYLLWWQ